MARNLVPVTLANGATVSGIANGNGLTPVGLYVPKSFSGTAITFNAYAANGKNLGKISDGAGSNYTRTIAASADQYVPLSRDLFAGVDQLQLISGTSQSGDCPLNVVFN